MDPSIELPQLNIPALLRQYGLSPKKSLGQNFLVDAYALNAIVVSAELPAQAVVLEVGPGLGSLTRLLAVHAQRVVAVELDQNYIPALEEVLTPFGNTHVVHGDILDLNPAELMGESGYYVVANIPYYITSALIRHLLEASIQPTRLVLTLQREVAERICAQPDEMSLLALSVQVYGQARVVGLIPAEAFYPPPKVDSAVVRVDLYPEPVIPTVQLDAFFRLAKAGFSQKRKTLRNSLAGGMRWNGEQAARILNRAGINPQRRAETLSLPEWHQLVESAAQES